MATITGCGKSRSVPEYTLRPVLTVRHLGSIDECDESVGDTVVVRPGERVVRFHRPAVNLNKWFTLRPGR